MWRNSAHMISADTINSLADKETQKKCKAILGAGKHPMNKIPGNLSV